MSTAQAQRKTQFCDGRMCGEKLERMTIFAFVFENVLVEMLCVAAVRLKACTRTRKDPLDYLESARQNHFVYRSSCGVCFCCIMCRYWRLRPMEKQGEQLIMSQLSN